MGDSGVSTGMAWVEALKSAALKIDKSYESIISLFLIFYLDIVISHNES